MLFGCVERFGKTIGQEQSWNIAQGTLLIYAVGNKKTPKITASDRYSKAGNGKQI
jgi:hypothetical protein